MPKRLNIVFFTTVFVLIAFVGICAAQTAKIGVVDYQRVLDSSSAGKTAEAAVAKEHEKMQVKLKDMEKEVMELKEKLEREALVMSKETREEQEREFRIKVNDLKTTEKKFVSDLKQKERELIAKIQEEVNKVVEELGKKDGYLLILERRECGAVYFPDSIDLTDKVIDTYNKKAAKGG